MIKNYAGFIKKHLGYTDEEMIVNMWFMLRDNSNAIKQNRLKF